MLTSDEIRIYTAPPDVPIEVVLETTLAAMDRCIADGAAVSFDNLRERGAKGDPPRVLIARDEWLRRRDVIEVPPKLLVSRRAKVRHPALPPEKRRRQSCL